MQFFYYCRSATVAHPSPPRLSLPCALPQSAPAPLSTTTSPRFLLLVVQRLLCSALCRMAAVQLVQAPAVDTGALPACGAGSAGTVRVTVRVLVLLALLEGFHGTTENWEV